MAGGKGKITGADGKPFKKGDPRINREGRPPKLPELDVLLAEVLSEDRGGGINAMKKILLALRKKAEAGDVRAGELIMDRAYGKLKQMRDVSVDFQQFSEDDLDKICDKLLNKK